MTTYQEVFVHNYYVQISEDNFTDSNYPRAAKSDQGYSAGRIHTEGKATLKGILFKKISRPTQNP